MACPGISQCRDGSCWVGRGVLEGTAWNVTVLSAAIPAQSVGGGAWDAFGGAPDPYVEVSVRLEDMTLSRDTLAIEDTRSPTWSDTVFSSLAGPALIGMTLTVYDEDFGPDQRMAECRVSLLSSLEGMPTTMDCPQPGIGASDPIRITYQLDQVE